MADPAARCVYCSGNEGSEVDHFRPLAVFPERALEWENLLWSCGICNRAKGDRPASDDEASLIVNPAGENPWDYFHIDDLGFLTPRWRPGLDDLDPRAVHTRELFGLDRDDLQTARNPRRLDLIRNVNDSLSLLAKGELDAGDLGVRRIEWLDFPFQPDVADYFLNGPGREESPFREFHAVLSGQ